MPKQGKKLTEEEQSERFRKAIRDLADAGELSPTADQDFERLVGATKAKPKPDRAPE